MYLMFYINENGEKVYTLKRGTPYGVKIRSTTAWCFIISTGGTTSEKEEAQFAGNIEQYLLGFETFIQTHISSDSEDPAPATMYLMFYINENGEKVYTLKKDSPVGSPTQSAHPARFSPDDKYSKHRTLLKKRFGLLPTQQPPPSY